MFKGKNKKKPGEVPSMVINPEIDRNIQPELPGLPRIEAPELQQPQQVQQQPVEVATNASIPVNVVRPVQQVQEVQQPVQPIAYIKQVTVLEQGIFQYVIEANYPLIIGNCEIRQ